MRSNTAHASLFPHVSLSIVFHSILLRSTSLVYKPIRRGLFSLTWSLRSYTSFALFHQVTTLKLLVITVPLWIITSKPWPPRPHPDPIRLLYSLKLDSVTAARQSAKQRQRNLTDEGWGGTQRYMDGECQRSLDWASVRLLLTALYRGEGWDDRRQKLKSKHTTWWSIDTTGCKPMSLKYTVSYHQSELSYWTLIITH